MHEVVRRLKNIIPLSIYQQDYDDISIQITSKDPVINSIEASSHEELSQVINNFHNNMNTESRLSSTNEQMINESISSKNLSKVVNEIVAYITKIVNEGNHSIPRNQPTLDYLR